MNLVSAPLPSSATSAGRRWRAMISSLQIVATTCQVVQGRFGCARSPCSDSLAMFCSDVFEGRGVATKSGCVVAAICGHDSESQERKDERGEV